jgi:mono/diheme cytochrome c family protein
MRPHAILLAALTVLSACKRQDMYTQQKYRTWDADPHAPHGATEQPPVPGTLAQQQPAQDAPQPAVITADMVARGRQRYDIFCTPCHGASGDGWGMVVQRGFPHPPDLASPKIQQAPARLIYDTITHGHGVMYSYAARVPPADRWAIAAYIRALQLSRGVAIAALPEQDRAHIPVTP